MTWLPSALEPTWTSAKLRMNQADGMTSVSSSAVCDVVAKFVRQLSDSALTGWLDRKLTAVGVDLDELASVDLAPLLADGGHDEIGNFVTSQLGQAPFADTGPTRVIRFAIRGLRWRIRARNTFDDVRAAERLAAAVQIIMAALADDELVLVEATVEIKVRTVRPLKAAL